MKNLIYLTLLYLLIPGFYKKFEVKEYDGYIIALIYKDVYDSHYSNEYFFLPNDFYTTCKNFNPDSLENHFPKLEKIIKKHGGYLVSNNPHRNVNSEKYIEMMYFYTDTSLNKINTDLFIKKHKSEYSIYAAKTTFKAELSLDYDNKTYWKLYIKDLDTLTNLSKPEIKNLKKIF